MTLVLRQAIPGRPLRSGCRTLAGMVTLDDVYYAYPSSTNVVLLHPSGELAHTLPFWDALHRARAGPSANIRSDSVEGVVARESTIVAWSGFHIVIWQHQGEWKVFSTIVAGAAISSVDYVDGLIAVGTRDGVEVWRLADADVVVWDRLWSRQTSPDAVVALAPSCRHVAWYHQGQRVIHFQGLGKTPESCSKQLSQETSIPREIQWLGWRNSTSDPYLYVIASSVLRIYLPVLDDPTFFQLLYSIDHRSFNTNKAKWYDFGTLWVPDAKVVRAAASAALCSSDRLPQEARNKLEAIEGEEMDIVLWFGRDGTVVVRSIMNLDRRPPTLIQSKPLGSFPAEVSAAATCSGVVLPGDNLFVGFPATHDAADMTSLTLSLQDLLLSIPESFALATIPPDFEAMSVLMTQDVSSFVRTPNGRGLLAIGRGGEISTWEKRRLGKAQHQQDSRKRMSLVGKGQWTAPSTPVLYSIYAKGRGIASYYKDDDGPRVVLQHLDPGDGIPTDPVPMPQFNPKTGDDVAMLLAVSNIDDGYSARKRRTRRAVIMAVTHSGEAWVWRIDPAPTSPHLELGSSPWSTPKKAMSESLSHSPVSRSVRVEDSPVSRSRNLKPGNDTGDSPTHRSSSRMAESVGSVDTPHASSVIYRSEKPIVTLISHSVLPVEDGQRPRFILPVDPMGWHSSTVDWESDTPLQDMVVTVSESGVLEFWRPRLGQHLPGHRRGTVYGDMADHCAADDRLAWTRTGIVRTEKRCVVRARCSSRKKTVLVSEKPDGSHEMTIWDSNVSEFSTGLELTHTFEHGLEIQDLDWTTTSDLQSVLAVGFPHHVVLVCEQRMSYVDITPGWAPFIHIDMRKHTSVPINDSIWIAGGSLAVGCGNQLYVFSRFIESTHDEDDDDEPEDVFQLVAHQNGPLADYHPTMLHQCLLWDKIDLVKRILCTLTKNLRECEYEGRKRLQYDRLDPLEFHTPKKGGTKAAATTTTDYTSLFAVTPTLTTEDDDEFNDTVVHELIERLDGTVIVPLSHHEKSLLAALAQATLEVEQSRRSLDLCGLRYLISIRTFVNRDRRSASGAATPAQPNGKSSGHSTPLLPSQLQPAKSLARISFRNIVWATHSESQEVLLQAATASCRDGKMQWEDAKRLGVFLWLKNQETIKTQLEVIARNRFMANEDRDPIGSSLFFFTLGKKQVVHGLWRQAPGHKEQNTMIKFLANDFSTERWKTAAMKNAYALLSKQRYEYAAAFFMLAGSPKDAITICLRQLDDWQLAVAIARTVEGDGPLFRWVLSDTVLPIAFGGGHRWLASWALWMSNRRDLAVRVLISPMEEVAAAWEKDGSKLKVGPPDNDDPSLLLLFQHLKAKTLMTAKGTSEVPPKMEFDFVLHNARVFCRMGCHPLGLDLLRSWSFDRPFFPPPKRRPKSLKTRDASPTPVSRPQLSPYTPRRRTSFMLSNPNARENMLMDMDPLIEDETEPPTRIQSPSPPPEAEKKANDLFGGDGLFANFDLGGRRAIVDSPTISPDRSPAAPGTPVEAPASPAKADAAGDDAAKEDDGKTVNGDARKVVIVQPPAAESPKSADPAAPPEPPSEPTRKVGNLMKDLKNDVQQGAMEFNMDNFF